MQGLDLKLVLYAILPAVLAFNTPCPLTKCSEITRLQARRRDMPNGVPFFDLCKSGQHKVAMSAAPRNGAPGPLTQTISMTEYRISKLGEMGSKGLLQVFCRDSVLRLYSGGDVNCWHQVTAVLPSRRTC
jgi:hypothetical protein